MKTCGTCGTCKHWDFSRGFYNEYIDAAYCKNVPHIDSSVEETEKEAGMLKPEFLQTKAFASDYEGYHASLLTLADFGCNQWEGK